MLFGNLGKILLQVKIWSIQNLFKEIFVFAFILLWTRIIKRINEDQSGSDFTKARKNLNIYEIKEILTIVGMKIMAIHIISDIGSESEIKDVDNAENTPINDPFTCFIIIFKVLAAIDAWIIIQTKFERIFFFNSRIIVWRI